MARILIVDDDDLIREMLSTVLLRAGHHVVVGKDGRDGLQQNGRQAFDLVLTDILMPGLDGIDLIGAIRKGNPEIKLIAMSGGGRVRNPEFLQLAKEIGATETLWKPFTPGVLLRVVNRVLTN